MAPVKKTKRSVTFFYLFLRWNFFYRTGSRNHKIVFKLTTFCFVFSENEMRPEQNSAIIISSNAGKSQSSLFQFAFAVSAILYSYFLSHISKSRICDELHLWQWSLIYDKLCNKKLMKLLPNQWSAIKNIHIDEKKVWQSSFVTKCDNQFMWRNFVEQTILRPVL